MPRDDLRSYPGYVGLVEVLLPSGRDLVEPPASHFPTLADPRSPPRSFLPPRVGEGFEKLLPARLTSRSGRPVPDGDNAGSTVASAFRRHHLERHWQAVGVPETIIEVPTMAGDPDHPASQGPAAMTAALRPAARRPAVRTLSIPARTAHVEAASLQVARALAVVVREVSELGHTPLIFAGSCDVAPGVLAGLADRIAASSGSTRTQTSTRPDPPGVGFGPG